MQEKKRIIGIPCSSRGENSVGTEKSYIHWVLKRGWIPRLIMPHEDVVEDLDLLLLTGGADMNPSSYNEIPSIYTSNCDVMKQWFYDNKLKQYIENGTSVFGICLGFQELGVYFSSKLTQHLDYHVDPKLGSSDFQHDVFLFGETKSKKNTMEVISRHHQGILLSDLSKDLVPILVAEDESDSSEFIVEAFRHKHLNIAGTQYHCENQLDNYSYRLVESLFNQTKTTKKCVEL